MGLLFAWRGNSDNSRQVIYSLHNYHGDTALTLTNEGKTTTSTNTLLAYGPFGESLVAGTQGTTTVNALNASDDTMGWAASPARKQEGGYTTSFIQMGARVYIPSLGRFLQVDPVDGGTLNGYVYVADPINSSNYSGQWSIRGCMTGGRAGAKVGGVAGTGVGTVLGGYGLPGQHFFDWGPDQVNNPFKY